MQRNKVSHEFIFVKLTRCQLCYLRQHLPNMMEVFKAQPELEHEVMERYSLCYSPIEIIKEMIWPLEEAAKNMDATPPDKARFT